MSLLGLDSVILKRRPKVASDTTTIPTGFPSSPPMSRAMTSSKLGHQKRRALVVITLPDHEAWLTNWQSTA
jgi:hypothetical protein